MPAAPVTACPDPNHCPVEVTLRAVGGRWTALVVYHLRGGPQRFNQLRRLIPGVTQRMLTRHLRHLERDGLADRTVYPEVPPRVEYALTARGRSLLPILDAMAAWGAARQADASL